MKKLFCVILSAIMITSSIELTSAAVAPSAVSATPNEVQGQTTEGYCDGFYYNVLDDGTAEITLYVGNNENLIIPDTINGITITSIRNGAFEYSEYLKNVTLNTTISHIGSAVFNNGGISIFDESGTRSFDYKLENIYVNKTNNHYYDLNGILFSKDSCEMLFYPSNNSTEYLTVPKGIKKVIIGGALRKIEIPVSVDKIESDGSSTGGNKLEQINVSSDNQTYCSLNGILYSKDMTELLWIPEMNSIEDYTIPETVTEIKCSPFSKKRILHRNTLIISFPYLIITIWKISSLVKTIHFIIVWMVYYTGMI